MTIRQVNITYFNQEDRLMLRLLAGEKDEFRFWLTRACLKEFMPQATNWLAATDAKPADVALQAFKREQAAASADLNSAYADGENFPLGETPILVLAMHLTQEQGRALLRLELAENRMVVLTLEEHAIAGIQRLLRETAETIGWDLPTAAPSVPAFGSLAMTSTKLH